MQEEFNQSSQDRIAAILDRLSKVPEGKNIVSFLETNKVKFDLQDEPANWAASTLTITSVKDGLYYYKDPVIILKKGLSDDNLLQAIIHESEHINQHLSHVGNPDRILSQEQCILFYRGAEADAQACCTDVSWKLKEAGDPGAWEATGFVGYKDICEAYEKAVAEDPLAAENGRAKRAAFDAWFSNPDRLAGYNKSTVESMIPFLEKGRNEIFKDHGLKEGKLDDSWLKKLDGSAAAPYLQHGRNILEDSFYFRDIAARPPEKKKTVTPPQPPPPAA